VGWQPEEILRDKQDFTSCMRAGLGLEPGGV